MAHNGLAGGDDLRTAKSVLACLESAGPLSRAAVAKRLDLSRTTLSNLIARFIEQKLVTELEGEERQGRGRPGIPVDLDNGTWFALGATFHSGRWVFALANLKGEVVSTQLRRVASLTPQAFLAALIKGIEYMCGQVPGRLLPGVGVGVPGLVDRERGVIIRAADLGWEAIDIRGPVEAATGLSAFVLNRNRATGMAEAKYGLGKNVDNFIYIGVGTGISAAIMLDGALVQGSEYGAGEIGHITVDPRGPLCGCGRRGCLQTLAAGGALVRRAEELAAAGKLAPDGPLAKLLSKKRTPSGEDICEAALAEDEAARSCVRHAAGYLAMVVGALITTLNPEKVIIGGPLVRVGPLLVDYVGGTVARWAMPHPFSQAVVEASALDEFAGALGAAGMVLNSKLELVRALE